MLVNVGTVETAGFHYAVGACVTVWTGCSQLFKFDALLPLE